MVLDYEPCFVHQPSTINNDVGDNVSMSAHQGGCQHESPFNAAPAPFLQLLPLLLVSQQCRCLLYEESRIFNSFSLLLLLLLPLLKNDDHHEYNQLFPWRCI